MSVLDDLPFEALCYAGLPIDSTSGGRLNHPPDFDPAIPVVLDVNRMEAAENVPLCLGHRDVVLGRLDRVWADGRFLRATGEMFRCSDAQIFMSDVAGLGWQLGVSVGAKWSAGYVLKIPKGVDASVNGIRIPGPVYHVFGWRLAELSVGLAGVDPEAHMRIPATKLRPIRPEIDRIFHPNLDPEGAPSPSWVDDRGFTWKVAADELSIELFAYTNNVALDRLDDDGLASIINDKEFLIEALYCLSAGPWRFRPGFGFGHFYKGFQTEATYSAAAAAFLEAMTSYRAARPLPTATEEASHVNSTASVRVQQLGLDRVALRA